MMVDAVAENTGCSTCGAAVRENTQFCYNCGSSLRSDPETSKDPADSYASRNGTALDINEPGPEPEPEPGPQPDPKADPEDKAAVSESEVRAKAAAARRRSRVERRKPRDYTWEPVEYDSPLKLLVLAAGIFLLVLTLVVMVAWWK